MTVVGGAAVWPVADDGGPYTVEQGGSVLLTAAGSSDADGSIVGYEWDLDGDGVFGESGIDAARGDEAGFSVVFSAAGLSAPATHDVSLRATDNDGKLSAVATTQVNVGTDPVPLEIAAWMPTYFDTGNARTSFEENAELIAEISPFAYEVQADGTLTPLSGVRDATLVQLAHDNGVEVMPTITNQFVAVPVSTILNDPVLRAEHVGNIVNEVITYGYDGIDINYENLDAADRDLYTTFIEELATELHGHGRLLSTAVHPKTSEPGGWNGPQAQDWAALGAAVDYFRVMSYDFSWSTSAPGPISPVWWVEDVIDFAKTRVAPAKIMMGIPLHYGQDWPLGAAADARGWNAFQDLITTHDATVHWQETNTGGQPVREHWFTYTDPDTGDSREVWFADHDSVAARRALAEDLDVRGVALWRIGSEDPQNWAVLGSPDIVHTSLGTRTLVGTDVLVEPIDTTTGATPIDVLYHTVTQPGYTSLTVGSEGPAPPEGYESPGAPVYYDLSTSATFSGRVELSFDYDEFAFLGPEAQAQLFHFDAAAGQWVNATTSVAPLEDVVNGQVTSFSTFAVFEPSHVLLEQGKLTAGDPGAEDAFGYRAAVSGNTIVVAADGNDLDGKNSGAAYVFQNRGTDWERVRKLPATVAPGDLFGSAIAVDGDNAVVGAYGAESGLGISLGQPGLGGSDTAVLFDSSGHGRVVVPSEAPLNPTTITMEAVVDWAGPNGSRQVIVCKSTDNNQWVSLYHLTIGDLGRVHVEVRTAAGTFDAVSDVSVPGPGLDEELGPKTYVAATYDGTEIKIYVNDVVESFPAGGGDLLTHTETSLGIGNMYTRERPFNGVIDEVALYAGVLNTVRLQAHRDAALLAPASFEGQVLGDEPVAFWRFSEVPESSTAVDASGNGNDGTYQRGAYTGAAYLFSRNEGGEDNWGQVAELVADDVMSWDMFARTSVAIQGDIAVVGAPGDHDGIGSAYVFSRNQGGADQWGQVDKLIAPDTAAREGLVGVDWFGGSVAISGDTIVVGAPWRDDSGGTNSGAVYVFRRDGDTWGSPEKLTAGDDAGHDDYFGLDVDVSGDTIVVGAYADDDTGTDSGAAYVFRYNGTTWTREGKLTGWDADAADWFGADVAIAGDVIVVGAGGHDGVSVADSGAAFVFRRIGGSWKPQQKLAASDAAAWDYFGIPVSISGSTVAVGAGWDDDVVANSGSAYVFDLPEPHALYVWRDPAPDKDGTPVDLAEAQRLAEFAVSEGIRTIYYDNWGNGPKDPDDADYIEGAEAQDAATLAPIIDLLHSYGLRVEALYSDANRIFFDPDDPESPDYDPAVHDRYAVNYNNLVEPEARFDAIRLDVEASSFPGERWPGEAHKPTKPVDLDVYAYAVEQARGLPVYVSIGYDWDTIIDYGGEQAAYRHIVDIVAGVDVQTAQDGLPHGETFDDLNGNGLFDPDEPFKDLDDDDEFDPDGFPGDAGVIERLTQEEVAYANSRGKPVHVTVETYDVVGNFPLPEFQVFSTFFDNGEAAMKEKLATLDYTPLGVADPTGFAYHFYGQSFGSRSTPGWKTDIDGDGVFDEVDPQPTAFSDEFSDATTSGFISIRGDRTWAIQDEPDDPDTAVNEGVRITVGPGSEPAWIESPEASPPTSLEIAAEGADFVYSFGSSVVWVSQGSVEARAVADGREVKVLLGSGTGATFSLTATEKLQVTNNGTEAIFGTVAGEEFSIAGGEVLIVNRSPRVEELAGPVAGVRGQTLSFDGTFTDPDPHDTHTIAWDVTDGGGRIVAAGSGTPFDFTPAAADTYTLNFTVTDDAGAADTASIDVTASVVLLAPDPFDPTQNVLLVGGSTGRDKIHLKRGHEPDTIKVGIREKTNKVKFKDEYGPGIDRIVVFAQDGDDHVHVHRNLGTISTVLIGGAGDDKLHGGRGLDLLIGGLGADVVKGGSRAGGDANEDRPGDILIAGRTIYDTDPAALLAVHDAWISAWQAGTPYGRVVDSLVDNWLQPGENVFDDGVRDKLKGSNKSRDLFFAGLDGPDRDDVKGHKTDVVIELGESLTALQLE